MIKVGDYVRTKTGHIFKIIGSDIEFATELGSDGELPFDAKIISQNIIDLIEVGDFVNGMQVTRICFDEDGERILNLSNCILELVNDDIKSIITKEQFERMEYKVNE